MDDSHAVLASIRSGDDSNACVNLWVHACAVRDGGSVDGIAERARAKFAQQVVFLVAEEHAGIDGFVLATSPGSGRETDPDDAAVIGLLAVSPERQARGLGRELLRAVVEQLEELGYREVVLHVLEDNTAAIRLYESEGWVRWGDSHKHALLGRPMRTYAIELPVS